ncbi:M17 family metallopeptidase [Nostocoides sp. HKS02]|uniref:leucyl aminopeptidase family protein n=1 Tax=Nostocoides sp. HKS02 TaxID=1813880 RepID=UPI0012B47690|nr:leucyl aminopeptidase family protein [Tetrasphaera sp. HKS02]QGN58154.1 leucyl aminopeptidase [Tetrasphaera sp. HKS02]
MPAPDLLTPTSSDWAVRPGPLADVLADLDPADLLLALPVAADGFAGTGATADALALLGLDLAEVAAAYEPAGKAGSLTRIPVVPADRAARVVLLVGVGTGTPAELREAGAAVGRVGRGHAQLVTTIAAAAAAAADDDAAADLAGGSAGQAAFAEGLALGGYSSPRWLGADAPAPDGPVQSVVLCGSFDDVAVRAAVVRARATMLARNLAVTPSNIKNPAWVATQARTVARRTGLDIRVWTERELRAEGFGGLLAVGAGSVSPPRLVQVDYAPPGTDAATPRVVLVGKGITFDTGGLDLKPSEGMLAMKTDMSGAAVVLAVLAACAELGVEVRVTGLLALAENALGGGSYRPSDVVTQYGGTTVEIGNTDAEGRLVMADALAYADLTLEPDVLVDIATLTGAARVALGRSMAPVFATDDALCEALVRAGEATGELLWPFPLVEDYRPSLDSEVADINHIAGSASGGGSISAALFLREFAGSRRWAHLDIAGVGRSDVDRGLLTKGGTGFGARLLLTWLETMA